MLAQICIEIKKNDELDLDVEMSTMQAVMSADGYNDHVRSTTKNERNNLRNFGDKHAWKGGMCKRKRQTVLVNPYNFVHNATNIHTTYKYPAACHK